MQNTPKEHSAILSTFIKLPFVIKIFVLSILFLSGCLTQILLYCVTHNKILSTFIKLQSVIQIFVLSVIEWPLKTGFSVPISRTSCSLGKIVCNISTISIDSTFKSILKKTNTVKTLYGDIRYNSKILYNVNCICTHVPVKLGFEFITRKIQFTFKLFGDKQCRCKEGTLCTYFPL